MAYSAGTVSTLFWLLETRKTAELIVQGVSKEEIAKWSASAIMRLKQCYTKMLFEAGILIGASFN